VSSVPTAETLKEARWFGGKSRAIADTRLVDYAEWADRAGVSLVEVTYASGPAETYVLVDRFDQPDVARAIIGHFRGDRLRTDSGGELVFRPTRIFHAVQAEGLEPIVPMRGEQSNTSVRYGDALILKLFRRVRFGPNPDVEIGGFLTERRFGGTPPVAGSLVYVSPDGQQAALGLLQRFERNRGDAWTTTLARLRAVLEGADAAESLESVRRLAATTAQLHLALAGGDAPDFSAEPISRRDVEGWLADIHDEVRVTVNALAHRGIVVDQGPLQQRAYGVTQLEGALKIRHHGDFHLGQVLERDDGSFVIIDFEGEPSRPLEQRRVKRSPLRDVAGMLRSFDYARTAALRVGDADDPRRVRTASEWHSAARQVFLDEYVTVAGEYPRLVPPDVGVPLGALELEKAAYEVLYELNNRPDWLPIPLAAFTVDRQWHR
jgi:maltose alpha-D-glucosyltransferase/alpha-amylase